VVDTGWVGGIGEGFATALVDALLRLRHGWQSVYWWSAMEETDRAAVAV
jgi:hypothetical protein